MKYIFNNILYDVSIYDKWKILQVLKNYYEGIIIIISLLLWKIRYNTTLKIFFQWSSINWIFVNNNNINLKTRDIKIYIFIEKLFQI